MTEFLETASGRRIAYEQTGGQGPGIVFLCGLKSDMEGTKAVHLEAWARVQGRAFLRFDYSGHGASSGRFEDGCIGDWAQDAQTMISKLTKGPQVLVGSSMGGWIALILALRMPANIAGLVGIASAPDFTEDGYWASFSDAQKSALEETGHLEMPSDYDEPYIITQHLIKDGRAHLVLRAPLPLPFPVRFLQGEADTVVCPEQALRLIAHARGDDIRLTLVKDADHRFSTPNCLKLIEDSTAEILALTGP